MREGTVLKSITLSDGRNFTLGEGYSRRKVVKRIMIVRDDPLELWIKVDHGHIGSLERSGDAIFCNIEHVVSFQLLE